MTARGVSGVSEEQAYMYVWDIDSFSDNSQAGEEPEGDGSGRSDTKINVPVSRFSQLNKVCF